MAACTLVFRNSDRSKAQQSLVRCRTPRGDRLDPVARHTARAYECRRLYSAAFYTAYSVLNAPLNERIFAVTRAEGRKDLERSRKCYKVTL